MNRSLRITLITVGLILLVILVYLILNSSTAENSVLNDNATTTELTTSTTTASTTDTSSAESSTDRNPLLSPSQEKALEIVGIDPAKLPNKITPELESCAVSKLGAARVNEPKGGSTPTMADFLKAKSCL